MFNFTATITPNKLNHWLANNNDKLTKIDESISGYQLEVARPFWFDDISHKLLDELPLFTGSSKEEIFVKMYEYCLNNLKWKNDTRVNLIDYWVQLTEILMDFDVITIEDDKILIYDEEQNKLVEITENNFDTYQDTIFDFMFESKLDFYGFNDRTYLDCCFYVKPIKLV